jgi:hypothetical protein
VGIAEFFDVSGDPSSVVTRPKIEGETVFYQAVVGPISGAQCAISGGNLYLCTPDQVRQGFDATIASVQANCHFAGTLGNNCVGCTAPDPTLPGLVSVTQFAAPPGGSLIPYVVSLQDESALCGEDQVRARAFLVGSTVHSPTGNVSPANADVPACNLVQTCQIGGRQERLLRPGGRLPVPGELPRRRLRNCRPGRHHGLLRELDHPDGGERPGPLRRPEQRHGERAQLHGDRIEHRDHVVDHRPGSFRRNGLRPGHLRQPLLGHARQRRAGQVRGDVHVRAWRRPVSPSARSTRPTSSA